MPTHIPVTDNSAGEDSSIRRRNTQGSKTDAITITIPKELNQTINGIVVKTAKSRSLVIAELLEKGLENYEQNRVYPRR